jgi:putative nucleotidyltransferase with HDIG domain
MGLSLSVFEVFKGSGNSEGFDIARFWQHSIACGCASRMIARRFLYHLVGEAFVAGLLHDIGKVILKQYMATEFTAIIEKAVGGASLDDAENEIIGATHAQIGAWLAEKWNLPKIIVESIACHHTPWDGKEDPVLVAIVSVANYLCHICGIGHSGRISPLIPDARTYDILRKASMPLEESDLMALQTEFLLEFDKTDSMLSFMSDDR